MSVTDKSTIRLYFIPLKFNEDVKRKYLAEWIKPFFPKNRLSSFGLNSELYVKCENPAHAHIFILPLTWNYYFEMDIVNYASNMIAKYLYYDKPIFTWANGDFKLKIPGGNFFLFQNNCYHSKRKINEYAYPVIIRDPLKYLHMSSIKILDKENIPKIGFCGLSDNSWFDVLKSSTKNQIRKLKYRLVKPFLDMSEPISGTSLRYSIIKKLRYSKHLHTDFIIRSSYGGQSVNNEKHKREYWKNLLECPYILCARGAGNYSTRFYESLAVGRIPIFINTDCILPFEKNIEGNKHYISININELDSIEEIIINYHNKISSTDFKEIQYANRILWEKMLTFDGFMDSFLKNINTKVIKNF